MKALPSEILQKELFETLQIGIDSDLRDYGVDQVVRRRGLDVDAGRIVVGRNFGYSTRLADIGRDLDPLAIPMTIDHEVGVKQSSRFGTTHTMLLVSQAVMGGPQERTAVGMEMTRTQFEVVESSIDLLMQARQALLLPFLTKSLRRVDLAGD